MKTITKRVIVIGLLCAGAAACAPPITEAQTHSANFICDGGQAMQVRFATDRAVLESGGVSVAMIQTRTADGYRYAGGGQSLRGRGDTATWTDKKGAIHQCRDADAPHPKASQ